MAADKIYRVIEADEDGDGKDDLSILRGQKKLVTVYDWKSIALSWITTTTALFAAGMGIVSFGM